MSVEQQVTDFVRQVVRQMGLALEARVETTADGMRINLEGEGGETLLARRGAALQALQHVVDGAFRRHLGDQRVLIDCDFRRAKTASCARWRSCWPRARASGLNRASGR